MMRVLAGLLVGATVTLSTSVVMTLGRSEPTTMAVGVLLISGVVATLVGLKTAATRRTVNRSSRTDFGVTEGVLTVLTGGFFIAGVTVLTQAPAVAFMLLGGLAVAALWSCCDLRPTSRNGETGDVTAQPVEHVERSGRAQIDYVAGLSTMALCAAWQTSYFVLHEGPGEDSQTVTGLIEFRAALLDEIEQRDPAGFASWLRSGARANSSPGRYLTQLSQ